MSLYFNAFQFRIYFREITQEHSILATSINYDFVDEVILNKTFEIRMRLAGFII
ncbi:hypothetical protein HMPREF3230_00294 [Gardnerella vaginalis]|uniref:Uncharacterized protein n=1 Tax=Gardnerella vaginalis TaxID=2702 RepID=A0A135ZA46_GARVA|nr:hypothetical protein HMPREF3230_00294 [Gardnerella vaginalis]